MAVQTTYPENMSAGRPGQLVNTEPNTLISRNVEDATTIAFGAPVTQGAADRGCKLAAAGATKILGIAVLQRSSNPETPGGYAQYESARIAKKGVVYVTAGGAVDAGDDVYVTLADASYGNASGAGIVKIENARYDTSAAAEGDLVQVRLG